jgi:hypothetical protein
VLAPPGCGPQKLCAAAARCACDPQAAEILLMMRPDSEVPSDFQDYTLLTVVAVAAHLSGHTLGNKQGLVLLAKKYRQDLGALEQVRKCLSELRLGFGDCQQLRGGEDCHGHNKNPHARGAHWHASSRARQVSRGCLESAWPTAARVTRSMCRAIDRACRCVPHRCLSTSCRAWRTTARCTRACSS